MNAGSNRGTGKGYRELERYPYIMAPGQDTHFEWPTGGFSPLTLRDAIFLHTKPYKLNLNSI